MNEIEKLMKDSDELNTALKRLEPDNMLTFDRHISLIIDLMVDLYKDDGDWIEWYIYNTNFGKESNKVILNEGSENEEEVIVDSVEKLLYVMK